MKNAKIFLVDGERKLTPMKETNYEKEQDLQALLAAYPDLIPGDQIDFENPRRWLLVARELGVPGSDEETGRWSLDHLFLDQDGIPTFVECKRSSDTRSRREVVAQMLDYAANGTSYWKMDSLRQSAAETAQKNGKSLDDEILKLIDPAESSGVDEYWKRVEHNLKSGNVRLIFVADNIPTELRRLVEFLNEQMISAEVLAVEVKQFLGEGQKAIVPRVIGMTEAARENKRPSGKPRTNKAEFMSKCTPEANMFFEEILDGAEKHGHTIYWGTSGFSIRVQLPEMDNVISIAYGYPPRRLELLFGFLPWPENAVKALRKEILASKIFREAPKMLSVNITSDTIQQAKEAYGLMEQRVLAVGSK